MPCFEQNRHSYSLECALWLHVPCRLKGVSASQGLMLEGTSPSLTAPGGPHWGCPDKDAAVRLDTLAAAGAARVPFTSGRVWQQEGVQVCRCLETNGASDDVESCVGHAWVSVMLGCGSRCVRMGHVQLLKHVCVVLWCRSADWSW